MDLAIRDLKIEINRRYKEKSFYTEKELISILKQLSSACVYLQKREIAHRDIKPENILLFKENNKDIYKVCDFCEDKEKIVDNQRHKSIRGTNFYMSRILFKGLAREEKYMKHNSYKMNCNKLKEFLTVFDDRTTTIGKGFVFCRYHFDAHRFHPPLTYGRRGGLDQKMPKEYVVQE